MTLRPLCLAIVIAALAACSRPAAAQNDWQFPDPYFGAFQHRDAGTPQAERRYRAEIAPQQPQRLHARGPAVTAPSPAPRPRWMRHRSRARAAH